jgi:hypothetical protein
MHLSQKSPVISAYHRCTMRIHEGTKRDASIFQSVFRVRDGILEVFPTAARPHTPSLRSSTRPRHAGTGEGRGSGGCCAYSTGRPAISVPLGGWPRLGLPVDQTWLVAGQSDGLPVGEYLERPCVGNRPRASAGASISLQ